MSMWHDTTLEDVCLLITDGAHNSPPSVDSGFPMASVKDLTPHGINIQSCRLIAEDEYRRLVRQQCQPLVGDVLIAKDGNSALDTVCEIKTPLELVLLSSVAILRPNPKRIASSFLRYYLDCDSTRKYLKGGFITGAAIPRVIVKDFKRAKIAVPPLPTQRKIAGVLSAYDDLIENNTRRIATLEEMAQAIYREWFVNFRFPGHDKVKHINSPLGKIPHGWKHVKVEDAVFINPKVTVPKDGDKPFVSMGAVPHNTMLIDVAAVEMRTGNSGSKFQNGDTLFARITPCLENGKTAFVQFLEHDTDVAFGSTEFIVLRSKTVCPQFVYLLARSDPFRDNAIKSMSGATGRQRVQEKCFDSFFFAHPDKVTLARFEKVMQPVFREIFTLARKNRNLRTTRDLLLPKLMSGQLDVAELDIETAEPLAEAVA